MSRLKVRLAADVTALPRVRFVQVADCIHGSPLHFALPGVQRWGAGQAVSLLTCRQPTRTPSVNLMEDPFSAAQSHAPCFGEQLALCEMRCLQFSISVITNKA